MPRRRTPKAKSAPRKSHKVKKSDATLTKWKTVDDIPLDEVDQFHSGKDKILLEGDEDIYDDGEDDEVFGLKGLEEEDDDEDVDMEGFEDDDEEEEEEAPSKAKSKKSDKKSKDKKKAKGELSSDEEDEAQEEEEETWGRGKAAYYNSNADELESDDEEGHELEEQEAKRLQAKAREDMTDEDFGLKDIIEISKDEIDFALEEPTPVTKQVLPTEPKALLRHLEKTSPEAVALARDWEDVSEKLVRAQENIKKTEKETPDALSLGMLHLHYQTLLSYSTVLAFYLHLRASEKYAEKPSLLQSHPIMQRLLTLKQALITLEDLDFAGGDSELEEESDSDDYLDEDLDATEMKWDDILADRQSIWDSLDTEDLDEEELRELLADANAGEDSEKKSKSKKEKASKKDKKAEPSPKKKRKVEAAPVFDLEEPEWEPTKKSSSRKQVETDDAYGEASHLHQADAEDKTARKKTLRFHTSRIETASARRSGARNQAVGGDDDIPYRERQKQKELRLEQEARMRLAKQGGEDLDDEAPPEKRKREDSDDEMDGGDDSADEYYELIKKKSTEKKVKKKEEYDAARAAEKPDYTEEEADGPRSLTRAILKNRGLTPHRSKAVRNPRVKKRQKFEKAKKKVSSQKAIYKGGLSESGGKYGGEKSGISKVVKSVRLV
ncbi:hypothetical protein D9611_008769 [Ephemerocybe angulata]|uniref:Sas10 C-terminal domain-containing protein n=1 Tax=Ephemerocybe angulata TaxID=980116 RepID=A0A8H5CCU3_9AGAR|nr:hypothetical protein D9611_008769 [Tulosesus angulatus]